MQQVIDLVLAAVPSVGSRKTYREVYDTVPAELRPYMRKALLHLKAEGRVKSENTFEEGAVLHELVRVGE